MRRQKTNKLPVFRALYKAADYSNLVDFIESNEFSDLELGYMIGHVLNNYHHRPHNVLAALLIKNDDAAELISRDQQAELESSGFIRFLEAEQSYKTAVAIPDVEDILAEEIQVFYENGR